MTVSTRALACLVLGALLSACQSPADSKLHRLRPPADWESDILAMRQSKDENFIRDPQSPLLAADRGSFLGLDYWPLDPDLYFVGRIQLYREPETFRIPSTSGGDRPCEKTGFVEFDVDGAVQVLQVYRLLDLASDGSESLFVPFRDATTGQETYPAGRYLDLVGSGSGPYVFDFNRAKNPFCAYGDPSRYVCPVAPAENTISVRMEVGERGFKIAPAGS